MLLKKPTVVEASKTDPQIEAKDTQSTTKLAVSNSNNTKSKHYWSRTLKLVNENMIHIYTQPLGKS